MSVEITKQCIIEEYLNNWFTYEELAQYLCVEVEEVKSVLDNGKLIMELYDMKKFDKIRMHKLHIHLFHSNQPDKQNLNSSDLKVLEIANFIIKNKSSVREASNHFGIGKTTIHDYMHDKLPNISINIYKRVFDVFMENKSFNVDNKKIRTQVLLSYDYLKDGYSSTEIQEKLQISRNVLQRNLTTRLKRIDEDKYIEATNLLYQNQMAPLEEYAFKPKNK